MDDVKNPEVVFQKKYYKKISKMVPEQTVMGDMGR